MDPTKLDKDVLNIIFDMSENIHLRRVCKKFYNVYKLDTYQIDRISISILLFEFDWVRKHFLGNKRYKPPVLKQERPIIDTNMTVRRYHWGRPQLDIVDKISGKGIYTFSRVLFTSPYIVAVLNHENKYKFIRNGMKHGIVPHKIKNSCNMEHTTYGDYFFTKNAIIDVALAKSIKDIPKFRHLQYNTGIAIFQLRNTMQWVNVDFIQYFNRYKT